MYQCKCYICDKLIQGQPQLVRIGFPPYHYSGYTNYQYVYVCPRHTDKEINKIKEKIENQPPVIGQ